MIIRMAVSAMNAGDHAGGALGMAADSADRRSNGAKSQPPAPTHHHRGGLAHFGEIGGDLLDRLPDSFEGDVPDRTCDVAERQRRGVRRDVVRDVFHGDVLPD